MLLTIKRKLLKHAEKISQLATDHNKSTATTMTLNSINLTENPDRLIEIEVKGSGDTGWIYRGNIDAVTFQKLGEIHLVSLATLRLFVEGKAKVSGKAESDIPAAYHMRRQDGAVYYYITEEDFIELEEYENDRR